MPRPPVLGYLQSAVADNTAHSQMDKLLFEDEMSNIQPEWGTMSEYQEGYDPVMEFAEGMIPIGGVLKSLKGVKGSRTLLDDALSKYGKKAHNQIRELIDYDRAIAMDIPEKSHFLQRGISRMFRVVEPDKKKVQRLEDLWTMEDWEEFTEPLMKRTSNLLKGKGTKGMQQGGPAEPLRKTPKRKREKVRDFLTNISEKNKLFDLLYSSPEESFDKTIGGSLAFGVTPKGHHDRDSRKSGDMQMVLGEGLKDLWRQSGSPRIKMHDKPHASYEPSEKSWEYGKKTPLSFMKKMFGSDKIYLPKDEFGGADKGMAIAELAHGMRFADPEQFSKYGSRKELVLGKGQEHAEEELYLTPGTDEYATHREVEPVLRDWLIKNYSAGFQQGGPAERAPLLGYMNPAVQDETAHSQMDRLMFENELEQQPQHSMRTYQQGYDPAMEWGEGMMPIGGMLRGGKGTLAMLKHSYGPYAKQSAHYRDILDKKLMNILKKYESQTRGRNIEKSLSTGAGQEATKEAMETDYIIQKLGGKYTN